MGKPAGLKQPRLTAKQAREAYAAATERDSVNGFEKCQRCGMYGPCDRDHRQNRNAFNTTPANLQLLGSAFGCGCHLWKTENPAEAMRLGFSVSKWDDPRKVPAWRYGIGWVLYLDEPDEHGRWWTECDANGTPTCV